MSLQKIKNSRSLKDKAILAKAEILADKIHLDTIEYTEKLHTAGLFGQQLFSKVSDPATSGMIRYAMHHAKGNQSKAARILGISRGTMRRYLLKYFGSLKIAHTENIKRSEECHNINNNNQ